MFLLLTKCNVKLPSILYSIIYHQDSLVSLNQPIDEFRFAQTTADQIIAMAWL